MLRRRKRIRKEKEVTPAAAVPYFFFFFSSIREMTPFYCHTMRPPLSGLACTSIVRTGADLGQE